MPKKSVSSSSRYWRDRALIARTNADGATVPRTKRVLRRIAEAYERLAEQIDRRSRAKKPK
jgi:hypothetical protein